LQLSHLNYSYNVHNVWKALASRYTPGQPNIAENAGTCGSAISNQRLADSTGVPKTVNSIIPHRIDAARPIRHGQPDKSTSGGRQLVELRVPGGVVAGLVEDGREGLAVFGDFDPVPVGDGGSRLGRRLVAPRLRAAAAAETAPGEELDAD
jgi:hypothetical protein